MHLSTPHGDVNTVYCMRALIKVKCSLSVVGWLGLVISARELPFLLPDLRLSWLMFHLCIVLAGRFGLETHVAGQCSSDVTLNTSPRQLPSRGSDSWTWAWVWGSAFLTSPLICCAAGPWSTLGSKTLRGHFPSVPDCLNHLRHCYYRLLASYETYSFKIFRGNSLDIFVFLK